jgi:hypothetical protein
MKNIAFRPAPERPNFSLAFSVTTKGKNHETDYDSEPQNLTPSVVVS